MSSSTIFIKSPINYRQSLAVLKEKYKEFSPFLSVLLWTIAGLYGASESEINSNLTGLTLSFPVYQLILTVGTSLLLCKGLSDKYLFFILPWMGVTSFSLVYRHYAGLINTLDTLYRVKKLSWLPWTNLIVNMLLLVIRVTLTIRIFQLCIHLWFKKKMKEMKHKDY